MKPSRANPFLTGLFSIALLSVFITLLTPRAAWAVTADLELPPWFWHEGNWGVSAWGDYSMSTANFGTGTGSYTKLPNGNSFNVLETNYKGRFAFHDLISVYGGTGYNYASAVNNSVTTNNGQPTSVFAGVDVIIPNRWIRLIPELEGGYPMNHVNLNNVTPSTSDGTAYARASLFFFKPLHFGAVVVDILGHGSLYAPGDNLAKLGLFETALEAPIGTMIALGGGINGFATLMSDSLGATQRNVFAVQANAGSFQYDAYNPSVLEAKGWVRFMPIAGYNFRLGYSKTLNGTNYANAQAITLAIAFNMPSIYARNSDFRADKRGPGPGPMQRPGLNDSDRLFEENRVQGRSSDRFDPDDHSEDAAPAPTPRPPSDGGLGGAEKILEQKDRGH